VTVARGMHELSIASAVVDSVLEFLDAHEAKKVLKHRGKE